METTPREVGTYLMVRWGLSSVVFVRQYKLSLTRFKHGTHTTVCLQTYHPTCSHNLVFPQIVHMHGNFAQTSCLKLAVHMCHFPKDQVVGLKPSLRKIRSMCTGLSTQSEEWKGQIFNVISLFATDFVIYDSFRYLYNSSKVHFTHYIPQKSCVLMDVHKYVICRSICKSLDSDLAAKIFSKDRKMGITFFLFYI